jgi:hypothetical protein
MSRRWLNTLLFGLVLAASAISASAAQIQGVLMDRKCSSTAEEHLVPGTGLVGGRSVAEAHLRDCALMPECQKSGYGVYTDDNKFLAFDEAGNRLALNALKASRKLDDLEVEVTGEITGGTIKVQSLKLL